MTLRPIARSLRRPPFRPNPVRPAVIFTASHRRPAKPRAAIRRAGLAAWAGLAVAVPSGGCLTVPLEVAHSLLPPATVPAPADAAPMDAAPMEVAGTATLEPDPEPRSGGFQPPTAGEASGSDAERLRRRPAAGSRRYEPTPPQPASPVRPSRPPLPVLSADPAPADPAPAEPYDADAEPLVLDAEPLVLDAEPGGPGLADAPGVPDAGGASPVPVPVIESLPEPPADDPAPAADVPPAPVPPIPPAPAEPVVIQTDAVEPEAPAAVLPAGWTAVAVASAAATPGSQDAPVEPGAAEPAARFDLDLSDGAALPAVLSTLARVGGLNVVAAEDVTGTVTATLHDVTVEEVLTALGRAHGFTHERVGNVIYVATLAAARARADEALAREAAAVAASRRVVTTLYRPHYVSAVDVAALIAPLLTPEVGLATATAPAEIGVGLDGANAGGDSLTQRDAVLVRDYPEVHEEIAGLLRAFDVPPAQVAIEAVILRVALNDETTLGVNFALLDDAARGLAVSGAGAALTGATGIPGASAVTAAGAAGGVGGVAGAAGEVARPFGTAFSAATTAGLKVGTVAGSVSSFVEALERFGTVSTVATPSVRVLNKQRGEVIIGRRLGYKTTVVNGAAAVENVQFIDAGTKLVLRPFVAPDGLIRLEVHPEKSTGVIDAAGVPQIATTEVTTNVMARDGQTVLIAGLIEETANEESAGVPVLGSLPVIGRAFRQTTERIDRSELVVLLTPRLVDEPADAARGAWLRCRGEEALRRALTGVPHHGRVPRAARLHEMAKAAFCEGELRRAWRLSGEAVRLHPTEPAYAALRRDVAAALAARGDAPPPWAAHSGLGAGDWTDPAVFGPDPCGPGCGCGRCAGGLLIHGTAPPYPEPPPFAEPAPAAEPALPVPPPAPLFGGPALPAPAAGFEPSVR